jgi:hypothetical protein
MATKPQTPKKGEAEPAAPLTVDARTGWFEERVLNALRLKSEKWKKMAVPENL